MSKLALTLAVAALGTCAAGLGGCSSDTSTKSPSSDGGGAPNDAASENDAYQVDSAVDSPDVGGDAASVDSGVDATSDAGDAGPVACNVPVREPPDQASFGTLGNVMLTPTLGSSSVAFTLTGTSSVGDGSTITFELTFPPGVDTVDAGGTATYQFVDAMTATPLPSGKATLQVLAPDGSTWGSTQAGGCAVELTIATADGGTTMSASFHDVPLSAPEAGASMQTSGSIQYPQ